MISYKLTLSERDEMTKHRTVFQIFQAAKLSKTKTQSDFYEFPYSEMNPFSLLSNETYLLFSHMAFSLSIF
ncbi:Oidioi.mRNA.OKI2018_I69.XSR.g13746.t1.cds [Oikopleura dioica]|uniref:Oidioi.mRNA.OKI2018_I69.XSR.g13746.t1.cds n=1 Tax=Oikopleura dioica TaxID=34765 RepID=A0ABN7S9I0_OIKDI|nr:Oidioi.mRNA.OKI2018_I69.XSR.g13746.t1.cds [Oikopleura dioica]